MILEMALETTCLIGMILGLTPAILDPDSEQDSRTSTAIFLAGWTIFAVGALGVLVVTVANVTRG